MPSLTKLLVTVDTNETGPFKMAVPVSDPPYDRNTTLFHLVSQDESLSFIGTYDQILDYAADMVQKVWSWAITSHHHDWFGTEHKSTEQEAGSNGNREHNQAGGTELGGDSSQAGGGFGAGSPEGIGA
jgi:hypothetical protein